MLTTLDAVVFDFDGVLNRNYDSGGFIWSRNIQDDHGLDHQAFSRALFDQNFTAILTGAEDLETRLATLLPNLGCATPAAAFMAYWFERDLTPCPGALSVVADLRAAGLRCVIGTNNERHRTDYLWRTLLKERVDGIYAAGLMGVAKPDRRFFDHIQADLGCADPARLLLVDDIPANIAAARDAGWQAVQYGDYSTRALGNPEDLRAAFGL